MKEKSWKNGNFTSESEFSDEMMTIRKDFVTIHGEMVLLKNYSSLNFAGSPFQHTLAYNMECLKAFSAISKASTSLKIT